MSKSIVKQNLSNHWQSKHHLGVWFPRFHYWPSTLWFIQFNVGDLVGWLHKVVHFVPQCIKLLDKHTTKLFLSHVMGYCELHSEVILIVELRFYPNLWTLIWGTRGQGRLAKSKSLKKCLWSMTNCYWTNLLDFLLIRKFDYYMITWCKHQHCKHLYI
jgi:hypothetical protein